MICRGYLGRVLSGDTIMPMSKLPVCISVLGLLLVSLSACDNNSKNNPDPNIRLDSTPGNVQAIGQLNNVLLTWDAVPGASSYNVYMASQAGLTPDGYTNLADNRLFTGVTATQFSHPETLAYDTAYYFIVTTIDAKGESAPSVEVSAIPFTDIPPVIVTAAVISDAPDREDDGTIITFAKKLTLETDMDTRIKVDLEGDEGTIHIDSKTFARSHVLPLVGMRPAQTYVASVTVTNRGEVATGSERNVQFNTEPLPVGFPTISVTSTPELMEPGYTVFDVMPHGNPNTAFGQLTVMVDAAGYPVWYHRVQENGLVNVQQKDDGTLWVQIGNKFRQMDLLGNTLQEWQAAGVEPGATGINGTPVQAALFHHDISPMVSGNFLTLSLEERLFDDYPAGLFSLDPPTAPTWVVGDIIVEFAPDGSIVNQWSLLDMLDPYRLAFDSLWSFPGWQSFFGHTIADWSHANAVLEDATNDAIIVSLRHQDAIIKFSRATGELIWILGTHSNWDQERFGKYLLTPVTNQQYFFPYHPHGPRLLPNGHLLVYDNGNYRASPGDIAADGNPIDAVEDIMPVSASFSRAAEYEIDEQNMTVALVWAYGEGTSDVNYSPYLGNTNQLPSTGNTIITHGSLMETVPADTHFPNDIIYSAKVIEVTRGDDMTAPTEVFNMAVTDPAAEGSNREGWRIYRSDRIASPYGSTATISITPP